MIGPLIRTRAATAAAQSMDRVVARLLETDLEPGPEVNALFGELVGLAVSAGPDHPWMEDPRRLGVVRRLSAVGETRLEAHWAQRVTRDPAALKGFPYLANYQAMAVGELSALDAAGARVARLVFVGCGPLPLTAILLARRRQLSIVCLDSDPSAVAAARRVLATRPGLPVEVICADGADWDCQDADVVLVAALAGADDGAKHILLERIAATCRPGAVIAARSVPADGRQLLYPRIDPLGLPPALTLAGEWTPSPPVINSLLISRVSR